MQFRAIDYDKVILSLILLLSVSLTLVTQPKAHMLSIHLTQKGVQIFFFFKKSSTSCLKMSSVSWVKGIDS